MTGVWLALVVLLLVASAFFVAAEFSLVAARRTIVEPLAVHSRRARLALRAMEDVSLMMACAQLGITLCGVLLGALGEPAVAALLEPWFASMGVPEAWLHPSALAVALLLVVSAHVALGEMVPKNIAIAGPERTAIALAPALLAIARAINPIIQGLNNTANTIVRWTGREPRAEVASAFTRGEVADLVHQSRAEGLLDEDEHQRITSALDFDVAVVTSVMVPDPAVVSLSAEASAAELERACARTGFSRFPIRDADGRYSGYLHIRDVIDISPERREDPVPADRIRTLPAVEPDTDLRTALDRMRRIGAHMAQVADGADRAQVADGDDRAQVADGDDRAQVADGDDPEPIAGSETDPSRPERPSSKGLVMLEDVLEALVGEIRDATRRRPDPGARQTRPSEA